MIIEMGMQEGTFYTVTDELDVIIYGDETGEILVEESGFRDTDDVWGYLRAVREW